MKAQPRRADISGQRARRVLSGVTAAALAIGGIAGGVWGAGSAFGVTPPTSANMGTDDSWYGLSVPISINDQTVYTVGYTWGGTSDPKDSAGNYGNSAFVASFATATGGVITNSTEINPIFPIVKTGTNQLSPANPSAAQKTAWDTAAWATPQASGVTQNQMMTMAVDAGAYLSSPTHVGTTKTAYFWPWSDQENQSPHGLRPANPSRGHWVPVYNFDDGQTTGKMFYAPSPYAAAAATVTGTYAGSPEASSVQPNSYDYWSGGEVIQKTGEIFFSGGECSGIGDDYRMMILDPSTGAYRASGRLKPATPSDNIFGNNNTCSGSGYVASDMTLDGYGNAYIIVTGQAPANSIWAPKNAAGNGVSVQKIYLVRVVPGAHNSGWQYNVVQRLEKDPSDTNSNTNYFAGSSPTNSGNLNSTYGSAFLNGNLYIGQMGGNTKLLRVDPASGYVTTVAPTPLTPVADVRDLASGQTAYVVAGHVFNDPNGDGTVDDQVALADQTVALYNQGSDGTWTFAGERITDGSGNFSFIVGGAGTYQVRLVQPQVDGRNAVLSYASAGVGPGGSGTPASLKAHCVVNGTSTEVATSGPCAGNLVGPYTDPALTAAVGSTVPAATATSTFPYYTTVVISSPDDIPAVDFGVTTAGSYGDAAAGPATVAANAPYHLSPVQSTVYLGAKNGVYTGPATDNAAHNGTDDGVVLKTFYGTDPLQGITLAATKEYSGLEATVSGSGAASAHVTGWTTSGASWTTTPAWTPTVSNGVATGKFQYQTSGSAGSSGQIRVDASAVQASLPTNANGEYPGTGNWMSPGEIEDYSVNLADSVYRVAATTTSGSGSFTVDGQTLAASGQTVVAGPSTGVAPGSKSFTATVPTSDWRVTSVTVKDVETGDTLGTETATQVGTTKDYTFSHTFAAGDDVVLVVNFASTPSATLSTLTTQPTPAVSQAGVAITAKATVVDSASTPLPGITVNFSVSSPDVTLSAATCQTAADGTCSVTVNSNVVAKYPKELHATVDAGSGQVDIKNSPVDLEFTNATISGQNSGLTVNPDQQNAGTPVTATVTVKDVLNNPVLGLTAADIVLSGNSQTSGVSNSQLEITGFQPGTNGTYTYQLTSKLAGVFQVTGTAKGVEIQQKATVTFTAGGTCVSNPTPVNPDNLTRIEMTVNDQLADGKAQDKAKAYSYDCFGNPVVGAKVEVTDASTGNLANKISPSVATATTGTDGTAELTWTSDTAGSFTAGGLIDNLKPTVGGVLSGDTGIRFSNGSADPTKSTLVVTPASPIVAGETYQATATVNDSTGNPVSNEIVSFAASSGNVTLSDVTCQTNALGVCYITASSKLVGKYTLSATVSVSGEPKGITNSPAPIEFVAGVVCVENCSPVDPANVTRVAMTTNGAEADGKDKDVATAYAYDRYGNAVSGATVLTSSQDTTLNILQPSVTTDDKGTATVEFTSTVAAPDKHADVSIDAKTPQGSPLTMAFGFGVGDPTRSTLSITPTTSQEVGSTFTVKATVRDAQGNMVTASTVNFTVDAPAGVTASDYTLSGTSCTTASDGTCTVTLTSTKAGDFKVHGLITGTDIVDSPVIATFTAGEVCVDTACNTKVDIITNGVNNDGTARDVVRVSAYDKYGNPVAGATVQSTTTDKDLNIQPTINPTGPDGTTTIWYTSTVAGSHTADVTVNETLTPKGSPVTIGFGAGLGDPSHSSFAVSPAGPLTVGQDAANTYTATATIHDAFDKPAPGEVVTFAINPSTGTTWVNGASCTTGDDGTCSASIFSTKSGTFTISSTIPGGAIQGGLDAQDKPFYGISVAWKPDKVCSQAAGCDPVDPETRADLRTRVVVTEDNQVADGNSRDIATVFAFDKWGNPVPSSLVASTTTDQALTIQTGIAGTDDQGTTTVWYTSPVVGAHVAAVTADGEVVTGSPITLNFIAGSADPGQSSLTVDPASQEVDKNVTATVIAKDVKGNFVPGVTVTFAVTGSATLAATTATTDANGKASTTLTDAVAETVSVSATVRSAGQDKAVSGSPAPVVFTAGPVCMEPTCEPDPGVDNDHRTRVVVTKDNGVADGVDTDQATVWAFDKHGNAVGNATVGTTTTDAGLTIVTPGAATIANGSAVLTYTSTVAAPHAAAVTIGGLAVIFTPQPGSTLDNPTDKAKYSSPITLNYVAGPVDKACSKLSVNPATQLVNQNVTATGLICDAKGNPVPGQTVSFTVDGKAVLSAASAVTGPDGKAVVTLTDKTAETVKVSASAVIGGAPTALTDSPQSVVFKAEGPCVYPDCTPDPNVDNDHRTRIEITTDKQVADGVAADLITVWIFDQYGNAVKDVPYTSDTADAALIIHATEGAKTADNGSGTISYTSEVAGQHVTNVYAEVDGKNVPIKFKPQPGSDQDTDAGAAAKSSPATLTFVPGAPVISQTFLTVDPLKQVVGKNVTATVISKDAKGNAVPGVAVTFGVTGKGTFVTPTPATPTPAPAEGDTSGVTPLVQPLAEPLTVTEPADVTTPATPADPATPATPTTPGASAPVQSLTVTTGADGKAVTDVTTLVAETMSISATIDVNSVATPVTGSPVSVEFSPEGPCVAPDCTPEPWVDNDHRSRVQVLKDNAAADGTAQNGVAVWVFDRYGNPVPDTTYRSTSSVAALKISKGGAVDSKGYGYLTYSSTAAGALQAKVEIQVGDKWYEVIFTPQPGSALDNAAGKAKYSSPVTLNFAVVIKTGGAVLQAAGPNGVVPAVMLFAGMLVLAGGAIGLGKRAYRA